MKRKKKRGTLGKKYIRYHLERHFSPLALEKLVTSSRLFPARMRADLQRVLDKFWSEHGDYQFLGIHKEYDHSVIKFASFLNDGHDSCVVAPAHYEAIDIGEETPIQCLHNGLWMGRHNGSRFAALTSLSKEYYDKGDIHVEVTAPAGPEGKEVADIFFRRLEKSIQESKSYRGKVISFEKDPHYQGRAGEIKVHRLPMVKREDVVLPQQVLELLERNIFLFDKHSEQLLSLNMSRKKGLLLYGSPGTGKTHTIKYLASVMKNYTTFLITADQMGILSEYMSLARLLQPSIVVIEDVDLIAKSRERMDSPCEESLLNRLLNEMDGLVEDTQIIFILTTNRPESLEQALVARPGRIDQVIEFPLPDGDGIRKLIHLYSHKLPMSEGMIVSLSKRLEGVSPAFIKELMRRVSQFYIEGGRPHQVSEGHIDGALQELLFVGGRLNLNILGPMKRETKLTTP